MKTSALRHLIEFIIVACGKLSTQASLLFSSILIARASLPSEFSAYVSALGIITVIDGIIGSPLDSTATRFAGIYGPDSDRTLRIQSLVFRFKLLFGVTALATAWLLRDTLSIWIFNDAQKSALLVIAGGSSISLLLLRGTSVFLQNHKAFRSYAILDTIAGLSRFAIVLSLFLLGFKNAEYYLSAYGTATLLIFLVAILVFRQPYIFAHTSDRRDMLSCLRFISLIFGIAVFGTLNAKADIMVVTSLYDSSSADLYAVAYQIAQFGTVLAFFASITTQPRVIPMALDNTLGYLMVTNIAIVLACSLIFLPIAFRYIPIALPWVFGEALAPAADIVLILLLGVIADWLTIPVMFPLALQAFPLSILLGEGVLLIAYTIAIWLIKEEGIHAFAGLVAFNRILHFLLYSYLGWSFLRLPVDTRRTLLHV